jgi:hypothetical protein
VPTQQTYHVRILSPGDCVHQGGTKMKFLFAHVSIWPEPLSKNIKAILNVKVFNNGANGTQIKQLRGALVSSPGRLGYHWVYRFALPNDQLVDNAFWKLDVLVKANRVVKGQASNLIFWRGPGKQGGGPLVDTPPAADSPGQLFSSYGPPGISVPVPQGGSASVHQTFQTLGSVDPYPSPVYSYIRKVNDPTKIVQGQPLSPAPLGYQWGFQYNEVPIDNQPTTQYTLTVAAVIGGVVQPTTMNLLIGP